MNKLKKCLNKHKDKFTDSEWREIEKRITDANRKGNGKTAIILILKEIMNFFSE